MDDDGELIGILLRKGNQRIEDLRNELETCNLEDLRHLQGQVSATREHLLIMVEQQQNWLRGDDPDFIPPTSLEHALDLVPGGEEL